MNVAQTIPAVRKTIIVEAPVAHAFEVFTAGLPRWWPQNYGIGKKPVASVAMEARLGGRWFETAEDGTQTTVARIIGWEPPHRLVMVWQVDAQWRPDAAMCSEVDVRFIADGESRTRVELLHHKFETMGAEQGASMRKDVDGGWPKHLEQFARIAAQK
ncbi:MAG: SRPBCC family protein [Hyphomicrobiales bacterium]|nr:SRPBCC family protein [Hyphomicrobiales bacterium]